MTGPTTGDPPWDDDTPRDEAWVAATFPDAGPPPSNDVVVDPDAPPAPNIGHP